MVCFDAYRQRHSSCAVSDTTHQRRNVAKCRSIIMEQGGTLFLKHLLDNARRCVVISVHRPIAFEDIEVREQLASGLGSAVHLAKLGGEQVWW
jgi:hypothetical protein